MHVTLKQSPYSPIIVLVAIFKMPKYFSNSSSGLICRFSSHKAESISLINLPCLESLITLSNNCIQKIYLILYGNSQREYLRLFLAKQHFWSKYIV